MNSLVLLGEGSGGGGEEEVKRRKDKALDLGDRTICSPSLPLLKPTPDSSPTFLFLCPQVRVTRVMLALLILV